MSWYTDSKLVIAIIHAALPEDTSLDDRKKAMRDGYPFGPREYHPYKMWCKAQREYLARYSTPSNDPKHAAWKSDMEARGFAFFGGEE